MGASFFFLLLSIVNPPQIKIAQKLNITKAILKDGSPSCGVNYIYDGSFSGKKINGIGITAQLLKESSIDIISELDLGGKMNGDI